MTRWAGRLPWIAGAAFFVAAGLWLALDRRVPREAFLPDSAFNTGPDGLSLAEAYLRGGGRRVALLTRPFETARVERDAVLFRVAPAPRTRPGRVEAGVRNGPADPDVLLSSEEESWIRGGGRLVLAVAAGLADLKVDAAGGGAEPRKSFPIWPGARRMAPPIPRALSGKALDEAHALWISGAAVAAARRRMGAGDLVLLSFPEIFRNARLGQADHLALLEALAGEGRPVWIDEDAHGMSDGTGVTDILAGWGFGPVLILLPVAALALFWRRRRRVGPEEDDARETRVEAVDFVHSLALLYDRALTRAQAIALYRKSFERAAALRSGARGAALEKKVLELAGPEAVGGVMTAGEFQRSLATLNEAFRRLEHEQRRGRGGTAQEALRRA